MVGRVKWLISSSLKLIDSPLKAVRALLTKNDPIRLSQEACFGMKMNLKRFGCLAKQFTIAWERWTERLSKVMGRPSLKVKSCLFNDRRLVEPFHSANYSIRRWSWKSEAASSWRIGRFYEPPSGQRQCLFLQRIESAPQKPLVVHFKLNSACRFCWCRGRLLH